MLVYPSSIDLSSHTLRYLTGQLRTRQREIGTRWRRLPVGRQALLALAHLRCGVTEPCSSPHQQMVALAERLPAAEHFDLYTKVANRREHFRFGREPDGNAAASWTWEDLE